MPLVIERCQGEGFWIGEEIHVRVEHLPPWKPGMRSRIKLAITAPRELRVRRDELPEQKASGA